MEDGSLIAWGVKDKSDDIVIWDNLGAEDACRYVLRRHAFAARIQNVRFSVDGRRVVSWDEDKSIRVWDRVTNDVSFGWQVAGF